MHVDPSAGAHLFAFQLWRTPTDSATNHDFRLEFDAATVAVFNQSPITVRPGVITARTDDKAKVIGILRQKVTSPVKITVRSTLAPGQIVEKTLTVQPHAPTLEFLHDQEPGRKPGFVGHWYAGTEFRHAVGVILKDVDESKCPTTAVVFRPDGGSATPDTARGVFVDRADPNPDTCEATTRWRFPDNVGHQSMSANLVGGKSPLLFEGVARRKPSIRVALGGAYRFPAQFLKTSRTDTVIVEVTDPATNAKETSKRTTFGAAVEEHDAWDVIPWLVGDFPVRAQWDHIRLSVGASLTNITEDFFVGLSVLQVPLGVTIEDIGFDLQAGVLLSRRSRLKEDMSCRTRIEELKALDAPFGNSDLGDRCETTKMLRPDGIVVTASVDVSSIVSTFLKKALGIP